MLNTIYPFLLIKKFFLTYFVLMKAQYKHVTNQKDASYSIEKFDLNNPCIHDGLHFHNSYEIVFIKKGKGKIIVDNSNSEYENGSLIFLGPCLPHFSFSNNLQEDNFEVVIHFDESFIEKRLKQIPEFHVLIPLINNSKKVLIYNTRFKEELSNVFEGLIDQSSFEQLASIFSILCKLASNSDYQTLLENPLGSKPGHTQQMQKIFNFINNHYSDPISTKDIASHLSLTTNSFCKLFKKLTNKSFISYLKEYRILKAVNLLETTDDNISEVAYKCGFENLSYFSKVFFRVKKISPINYKKSISNSSGNTLIKSN